MLGVMNPGSIGAAEDRRDPVGVLANSADASRANAGMDSSTSRRLLAAGCVILALGALTVTGLDVSSAGEPGAILHLTISQVGLTPLAPVFEAGVLAVAVGAALVLAVAVRLRRSHRGQAIAGAAAGAVAVVGFVLVAAFTKQDWSQPPELSGTIHRLGSLAAFLALPVAVIVLARRARTARRLAAAAVVAALAGMASFLPIVVAIVGVGMRGGWWQRVPLGLVERAIALGDIVALVLLAALCARELRPRR